MRQILLISFMLVLLLPALSYSQGTAVRVKVQSQKMVYYGTGKDANISIPAPESLLRRLKSGSVTAQFIVTYNNFPDSAKQAFAYSIDLWSHILKSSVPIRVNATWAALTTGVLGSTAPGGIYTRVPGSLLYNTYYASAIADKIFGKYIDSTQVSDINIEISSSSSIKWYFGTDGVPHTGKYDLATIVLHEITHGLGFTGTMGVSGTLGGWGYDNPPVPEAFDYFVYSASGNRVINSSVYPNPSTTLKSILTNPLYFNGPVERKANNGLKALLYAPATWSGGSSVYHLDPSNAAINALMEPSIGTAMAIHDPGPITEGILGDIGWISTRIQHDSVADMESIAGPIQLKATVQTDTAIMKNSMYLYFTRDTFHTVDSIPCLPTGNLSEYAASVTVPKLGTKTNYYFSLMDTFGRHYTLPSLAPANYFGFYVGPDTIKPVISHEPYAVIPAGKDPFNLVASVSDNVGIDTVVVEYKRNDMASSYIGMKYDSGLQYSVALPLNAIGIVAGDSLQYRIIATDSSSHHNIQYSPASGYYSVQVVGPQPAYHNDFNTPSDDFTFKGFSIWQPSGFYTPALHSIHPYQSPEQDNAHFDYFANLKVPIIVGPDSASAFMRFDEIALVEPGIPGAAFGTSDFYDYVVVEGSKDGGLSWKAVSNGWDANAYSDWLAKWNSNVDNNGNSLAVTDMRLYKKRKLNLLSSGNFNSGDTILLRFHLYSDPYAWGWGWVIDNLNVQDLSTAATQVSLEAESLSVYPNPASDQLNVSLELPARPLTVSIRMINLLGQELYAETNNGVTGTFIRTLPITGLNPGIYMVIVSVDGQQFTRKVSVVR